MYVRVGTYDGKVPLQEMADRFRQFDIAWAPSDYGTTVEHLAQIRDAFIGDLEGSFPGVWAYSMLVIIRPGGHIRMHKDLKQAEGLVRYHLVLATNDKCWNHHDGDWQQLQLGGIYAIDETKEHASINWGETPRVHLVVDVAPAPLPARELVRSER